MSPPESIKMKNFARIIFWKHLQLVKITHLYLFFLNSTFSVKKLKKLTTFLFSFFLYPPCDSYSHANARIFQNNGVLFNCTIPWPGIWFGSIQGTFTNDVIFWRGGESQPKDLDDWEMGEVLKVIFL